MTVYVDDAGIRADVTHGTRVVRGRWSHLLADTPAELLTFAVEVLGMRATWLQEPGTAKEHFDVTATRRAEALRAGAVPISYRESALLVRAKRAGVSFDLAAVRAGR